MQQKNLIIDVQYNVGGSSSATYNVLEYLINSDSLYMYTEKTRTNNALYKAWATVKILFYEDDKVPEYCKEKWYPYYYNTAFKEVEEYSKKAYQCSIADQKRYKGKIYVLISEKCGSAGEYFAAMLSQNKDITFLGKKTLGAFGQPLLLRLPSGIEVFINATKTYDFQGRDISSGFSPDYEYDFSEIFKIKDSQEMLNKLIAKIKELER